MMQVLFWWRILPREDPAIVTRREPPEAITADFEFSLIDFHAYLVQWSKTENYLLWVQLANIFLKSQKVVWPRNKPPLVQQFTLQKKEVCTMQSLAFDPITAERIRSRMSLNLTFMKGAHYLLWVFLTCKTVLYSANLANYIAFSVYVWKSWCRFRILMKRQSKFLLIWHGWRREAPNL